MSTVSTLEQQRQEQHERGLPDSPWVRKARSKYSTVNALVRAYLPYFCELIVDQHYIEALIQSLENVEQQKKPGRPSKFRESLRDRRLDHRMIVLLTLRTLLEQAVNHYWEDTEEAPQPEKGEIPNGIKLTIAKNRLAYVLEREYRLGNLIPLDSQCLRAGSSLFSNINDRHTVVDTLIRLLTTPYEKRQILKIVTIDPAEQPRSPHDQTAFRQESWLVPDQTVLDKLIAYKQELRPCNLPLVVPPKPWESRETGGYYYRSDIHLIRWRPWQIDGNRFFKSYAILLDDIDLSSVFSALRYLQNTPWQINHKLLELICSLQQQGAQTLMKYKLIKDKKDKEDFKGLDFGHFSSS